MTKTMKSEVKATNPKMVPESEAINAIMNFAHAVVFGNEEARMVLLDAINTWCPKNDETADADDLADVIMTLVYQDDEWREHYYEELHDNDLAMGMYDAAMEIREILNLDAYEEFGKKVREFMKLEDECKSLLAPKSATTKEESADK